MASYLVFLLCERIVWMMHATWSLNLILVLILKHQNNPKKVIKWTIFMFHTSCCNHMHLLILIVINTNIFLPVIFFEYYTGESGRYFIRFWKSFECFLLFEKYFSIMFNMYIFINMIIWCFWFLFGGVQFSGSL